MIKIFSPTGQGGTTSINSNSLILNRESIEDSTDFENFLASDHRKVFLLEEIVFINIQLVKADLISSLSFLTNFSDKLKSTQADIVIDISTGGISTSYFKDILRMVEVYRLDPSKVTILVNTQFEYDVFAKLISEYQVHANVVCTHRNEVLFIDNLFSHHRQKRFLFLCRRWTPERLFIFLDLHKRKILDNSFYSFSFVVDPYCTDPYGKAKSGLTIEKFDTMLFRPWVRSNNTDTDYVNDILNHWDEHKQQLFDNSPYWLGNDFSVQHDTEVASKFNDSLISLCVETSFGTDAMHFQPSEKIYKSCYYRHPFVVYSTPNFLDSWNKTGYKSFSGLFDESYDREANHINRIKMINDEVERINKMPQLELIQKINSVQSAVNHNQNLLTEKFLGPKQKNIYMRENDTVDELLRNTFLHG